MSIELAAAAVAALLPYLTEAGKEAAKTIGKETAEAGMKLLVWMREKLTGQGKNAFDDLVARPSSEDNQADLRKQLAKLLEAQPQLVSELSPLVSQAQIAGDVLNQIIGAGGKGILNKGSGNTNIIF
jgi:hypothetical protein